MYRGHGTYKCAVAPAVPCPGSKVYDKSVGAFVMMRKDIADEKKAALAQERRRYDVDPLGLFSVSLLDHCMLPKTKAAGCGHLIKPKNTLQLVYKDGGVSSLWDFYVKDKVTTAEREGVTRGLRSLLLALIVMAKQNMEHGDLYMRNIIIGPDYRFILIDFRSEGDALDPDLKAISKDIPKLITKQKLGTDNNRLRLANIFRQLEDEGPVWALQQYDALLHNLTVEAYFDARGLWEYRHAAVQPGTNTILGPLDVLHGEPDILELVTTGEVCA